MTTATVHTYRTLDVPVAGGRLRAGLWEPTGADAATPTVLAVHGITANHLAWPPLVAQLPGVRVVAPDLRGRGRSNALPGPFGMERHADDLSAVLAHLGVGAATVVGHSMGGFASVVLAHRHPEQVHRLVLVDGGLPLAPIPGLDADNAMAAVLGPAARRLGMVFPDHAAYHDFWRAHPAFARCWSPDMTAYFDYDLEATEGGWRASSRLEAMTGDQRELFAGTSLLPALEALAHPTVFLRAPRGLMDADPLYPAEHVDGWVAGLPALTAGEVADVNHYTIVMTADGAAAVAEQVRGLLAD